mmetsp:Transcript_68984/g.183804  ORF Transcript_68984/g.183804 Transcript_68984/m.183804 type:complete len:178 (-) Transcript_68984:236-769(-)
MLQRSIAAGRLGLGRSALARTTVKTAACAGSVRSMSMWRLRPYSHSNTSWQASVLSPGYTKVSLFQVPWNALVVPALMMPLVQVFRMMDKNSLMAVFQTIQHLVLAFLPQPCFENMFADLAFYVCFLTVTLGMYQLFPEVMLNDFLFFNFFFFTVFPLLPLAFTYMPLFASRTYLFM